MLSWATILLAAAVAAEFLRRKKLPFLPPLLAFAGEVLLLIVWISRSVSIGFPALTSSYEGLVFFALAIIPAALYLQISGRNSRLAAAGIAFALLLLTLASSPLFPGEAKPPIPALRSHWLVLHVAFAFLGEALFAIGFFASLFWLLGKDGERRERLDSMAYGMILIGYVLFTLGALIFGAVWAFAAWGRFWGWDPKETWALITWLTYSYYLHLRLFRSAPARRSHLVSVLGFVFTLITFLGVKYLSGQAASLHGY